MQRTPILVYLGDFDYVSILMLTLGIVICSFLWSLEATIIGLSEGKLAFFSVN